MESADADWEVTFDPARNADESDHAARLEGVVCSDAVHTLLLIPGSSGSVSVSRPTPIYTA